MSFVISSVLPFPNIHWWCRVAVVEEVVWDPHEYFEKMSYRNRYCIKGSSGLLKMSLPIAGGRDHKSVMKEVQIAGTPDWRKQHWRTIVSVYGSSPYFEHYGPSLGELFTAGKNELLAFSQETVHWLKRQLAIDFKERFAVEYRKDYPLAAADLRKLRPGLDQNSEGFPAYYQLFQESCGFIPNLSMLDLLFAEGPYAAGWLKEYGPAVIAAYGGVKL